MKTVLLIGLGSFIGGICRYLLSQAVQLRFLSIFPYGTLAVNIIGCFAIGIVFGLSEKLGISHEWKLFLATGVLGGFTTFSAFSNETIIMLRDGHSGYAMIYILCSMLLGLTATFGGMILVKL